MDIEDLKKEIWQYLDKFKELDINKHQHGMDEMNVLNPYFGYTPKKDYWGNDARGVHSFSASTRSRDITMTVRPRGWSGSEQYLHMDDLTPRQVEGVYALVKKLHDDRLAEIARTGSNPKLDDLLPKIKELAALWSLAVAPKSEIKLNKGRRQCDGPDDYYALVVNEDGWQKGSIPLRQDKWGKLSYNLQIPLCGSYLNDVELLSDKLEEQLKAAVEEVLGHPINLDRINRPLKDVVVDKNVRDVWYISCKIDGVQQLRKNLSPADRDTYLYRKLNCNNEYYIDELKYQMAEKYYANEIDLAQSQTNNRGRGR